MNYLSLISDQMLPKVYYLLFLVLGSYMPAFTQLSIPTNDLVIRIGRSNVNLKDRVFSKLKFDGTIHTGSLAFESRVPNSRYWSAFFDASVGSIAYNDEQFLSDYIDANFHLQYAPIVFSNRLGNLYIGGQLGTNLNVLDYNGFDSGAWTSSHSFRILLQQSIQIGKNHHLLGELHHPLISLVSRPPYSGIDEFVASNSDNIPKILFSKNRLYSLNKFINPKLSLKYTLGTAKIKFRINGSYEYLKLDSAQEYFRNTLELSASILYKL